MVGIINLNINESDNIYVAKQPILDTIRNTVAFEILYRNSSDNRYPASIRHIDATKLILAEQFLSSTGSFLEGKDGFINFDIEALRERLVFNFPAEKIVVEILETCPPDDELFDIIVELNQADYRIALDDFVPSPEWERFYPFVDIIKIDIQAYSLLNASFFIEAMSHSNITFIAEKVETYEEYQLAIKCGFSLFQGYFFKKPEVIQKKKLSTILQTVLELSSLVMSKDFNFAKATGIVSNSPELTYQLLKHVNNTGLQREIKNVEQAIVYLGVKRLQNLCSNLLLQNTSSNKPHALSYLALFRANFLQSLTALSHSEERQGSAYLCGLLSTLDAMLDTDIETITSELSIECSVKVALLMKTGFLGLCLQSSEALENEDWDQLNKTSKSMNLSLQQIISCAEIASKAAEIILEEPINEENC
ncbi:EAL domain-containing protein [Vibrio sp. MarTm2]|uniref:EAL and HDOD domain-containing protein n=1 Tax=Vibrio sp. MarTm2 TaxID=2998831 RepID=UPI0022CD27BA|nr:EAL domain-containing protein [Vibrio sp. MarTm2]MDA0127133.1 EAL domain-containing protein [Vibrio sp. MarTm2]